MNQPVTIVRDHATIAKLSRLEERLAGLEYALARLYERVDAVENPVRRGPGRPRKVKENAQA